MSVFEKIAELSRLSQKSSTHYWDEGSINEVHPPNKDADTLLASAGLDGVRNLADFYNLCDGMKLGAIHVGYFLNPITVLLQIDLQNGPLTVFLGEERISVRPFGSTGGGDLFVIEIETGQILFLPPDLLTNNCYYGEKSRVKVLSHSISGFLGVLIEDTKAYQNSKWDHRYLNL